MAWLRSPRVVYEVLDEGEANLLDPEGAELLTLNEVGTVVWEALDGRRGPAELARDLVSRFDGVTVEALTRDIEAFLAEIEAAGLVVPAGDVPG